MERGPQAPLPPSPSSARCRGLGSRAEQGEGKIYLHPPSSSPPRVSDSIAPFIILTLLPRTRGPGICPSSLRDLCSREPGWESEGPARRRPACTGRCGRRVRCPESEDWCRGKERQVRVRWIGWLWWQDDAGQKEHHPGGVCAGAHRGGEPAQAAHPRPPP